MQIWILAVVSLLGLVAAQEPASYPMSVSPILLDSAPFQEGLGLATIKTVPAGTFFLDRSSSLQASISTHTQTLSLWKPPAAIPTNPVCYSTSTSGHQFYQATADDSYLVMNQWSNPTNLFEATQLNTAISTTFIRQSDPTSGGFVGMLKFYSWHLIESSAQLNPLNIFQPNSNLFSDPVPQEPFININTSKIDPRPYTAPTTTIDLPQFYPVIDVVSSVNYTHVAIQAGNSIKLFSFDRSWNLLRKSMIIPAGGFVRGNEQEAMPLFDAGISLAADETTGGVYVVINSDNGGTLEMVETMLGFEVFGDNVTSALFWIPPPPPFTHPINATTIDMVFFSYIKVDGCCSIWPIIHAYNHRVVATGLCRVGSLPGAITWSQMMWVADLTYHNHQAGVNIVLKKRVTWDHRGTGTESRVSDIVILEGGQVLLVAGSVGFVAPSVTVAGGDAFVSLFNVTSGQEITQVRFGTKNRNNQAGDFVFSPISPSTDPSLIHTAPLSFFPFRILVPVSLNGPVGTDDDSGRYSTGAIYEVKFSPCSFSPSAVCSEANSGGVVGYSFLCGGGPTQPDSGKPNQGGVIAGAVIGSIAALALLSFVVYRFVLKKKQFHASATYDSNEAETTEYRQL